MRLYIKFVDGKQVDFSTISSVDWKNLYIQYITYVKIHLHQYFSTHFVPCHLERFPPSPRSLLDRTHYNT